MTKKLIVSYIIENEIDWLPLSLNPIIDLVDHVVIVDGGSTDGTIDYIKGLQSEIANKITLIENRYEHEYIGANGKQRNVYLKFVQAMFPDDWCLVLDADEVTNDIHLFRELIEGFEREYPNDEIICAVKMRHTIQDFQHEDNFYPTNLGNHFVPNRFFKISKNQYYPETEHPVLSTTSSDAAYLGTTLPTIWHFGHSKHMIALRKKYLNHIKKSNIHTAAYLQEWYMKHLLGEYPNAKFDVRELPQSIKDSFEINDDELYFKDRMKLEMKHMIEARAWWDYLKPKTSLEVACGAGQRTWALLGHNVDAYGFDISKWIIEKTPLLSSNLRGRIFQHDLLNPEEKWLNKFELVIAYDVMEHLTEEQVRLALVNIHDWSSKYALFSICFEGDPNFTNDPTHITCKPRGWWEEQIKLVGFEIMQTPTSFPYGNQIILVRKV